MESVRAWHILKVVVSCNIKYNRTQPVLHIVFSKSDTEMTSVTDLEYHLNVAPFIRISPWSLLRAPVLVICVIRFCRKHTEHSVEYKWCFLSQDKVEHSLEMARPFFQEPILRSIANVNLLIYISQSST